MPFSSNPLMAPVFQSPVGDRRDHKPPVVSIVRAGEPVENGIRLHHNQAREGYILQPEVEGLGVAPVELQTAPLASGGSVARHSRLAEGDVFLPITLVSPVPSALPGMFDALVDIVRPGQRDENGLPLQFEVVVFDPYGQETRSRRLIFESGLGDPVRVNHHIWRTSITGRFVDPYWYGQVRELRRRLGQVEKKFITAHPGLPVDLWPDPGFSDSSAYAPWLASDEGLVKWGTGQRHGGFFSSRLISVVPGDVVTVEAALSFVAGPPVGHVSLDVRALDAENQVVVGSQSTLFSESYAGSYAGEYTVPDNAAYLVIGLFTEADVHGTTQARVDALSVRRAGDEIVGAYSFPFFPVRIGGSVVQGEYELQVEGDAPAYWSGVITPPGEDLLIQNGKGERIFVKGRVDEPILIQTRPQEQDITLADGTPIWDRIDPGDDDFFPLHPGKNTVHVSMVGATQQSEILIRYREAFFHAIGGGR